MKYKVTLNGRTYEVEVEAGKAMCLAEYEAIAPSAAPVAAPVAAAPVAAAPAPAAAGSGTPIPSPLAAKVVSLDVQPGTAVKEGDQVMTVEAMKMNTVIYAPSNGTVTSFTVKPGDTVTEGQTLAYIG